MSDKMWAGRFSVALDREADDFNSSIHFDCRMYKEDITGSVAHAKMLARAGIISDGDRDAIVSGLEGILSDIESGALEIDMECEDIHMFVEKVLTARIGEAGKKLHTARSRNDQVALDLRMYMRREAAEIASLAKKLASVLCDKAETYAEIHPSSACAADNVRSSSDGIRDDASARHLEDRGCRSENGRIADRVLRSRGNDIQDGPQVRSGASRIFRDRDEQP